MVSISEKRKTEIESFLSTKGKKELEEGVALLEKIANIFVANNDGEDSFGEAYINYINEKPIDDRELKQTNVIEAFFYKLLRLKNEYKPGYMLHDYYDAIGFYEWEKNDETIKKAKRNDDLNKEHIQRERWNKWKNKPYNGSAWIFSKDEKINDGNDNSIELDKPVVISNYVNASIYRDCNNYFEAYVLLYIFRNRMSHKDWIEPNSMMEKVEFFYSYFTVILHQCILNKKLIEKEYENMINSKIKYKAFSQRYVDEKKEFEKTFTQLKWVDSKNNEIKSFIDGIKDKTIKLVGESMAGKSTQMRQIFYTYVDKVLKENFEAIPIWLSFKDDRKEFDEKDFEQIIIDRLGDEYTDYYNDIRDNNKLILFLDGYNEFTISSTEEGDRKKEISRQINNFRKTYKNILIYMTDRSEKTLPLCLEKDENGKTISRTISRTKSMEKNEIEEYSNKYLSEEECDLFKEYLNSDKSKWLFNDDYMTIVPGMVNNFIELIKKQVHDNVNDISRMPGNRMDFSEKYLNCILTREEEEKGLKYRNQFELCLKNTANIIEESNDPDYKIKRLDIIDNWTNFLMETFSPKDDNDDINDIVNQFWVLAIQIPIFDDIDGIYYRFFTDEYYYVYL